MSYTPPDHLAHGKGDLSTWLKRVDNGTEAVIEVDETDPDHIKIIRHPVDLDHETPPYPLENR